MLEKGCEPWEPSFGRLKGPKNGVLLSVTTGGREAGARREQGASYSWGNRRREAYCPLQPEHTATCREGARGGHLADTVPQHVAGWGRH